LSLVSVSFVVFALELREFYVDGFSPGLPFWKVDRDAQEKVDPFVVQLVNFHRADDGSTVNFVDDARDGHGIDFLVVSAASLRDLTQRGAQDFF
jgi:hypothetical protein